MILLKNDSLATALMALSVCRALAMLMMSSLADPTQSVSAIRARVSISVRLSNLRKLQAARFCPLYQSTMIK
jgi:hypothetical protein